MAKLLAELEPMDDDPRYPDDHFEDRAYPCATKEEREMLRRERQLIRDFFAGREARDKARGIKRPGPMPSLCPTSPHFVGYPKRMRKSTEA